MLITFMVSKKYKQCQKNINKSGIMSTIKYEVAMLVKDVIFDA